MLNGDFKERGFSHEVQHGDLIGFVSNVNDDCFLSLRFETRAQLEREAADRARIESQLGQLKNEHVALGEELAEAEASEAEREQLAALPMIEESAAAAALPSSRATRRILPPMCLAALIPIVLGPLVPFFFFFSSSDESESLSDESLLSAGLPIALLDADEAILL